MVSSVFPMPYCADSNCGHERPCTPSSIVQHTVLTTCKSNAELLSTLTRAHILDASLYGQQCGPSAHALFFAPPQCSLLCCPAVTAMLGCCKHSPAHPRSSLCLQTRRTRPPGPQHGMPPLRPAQIQPGSTPLSHPTRHLYSTCPAGPSRPCTLVTPHNTDPANHPCSHSLNYRTAHGRYSQCPQCRRHRCLVLACRIL